MIRASVARRYIRCQRSCSWCLARLLRGRVTLCKIRPWRRQKPEFPRSPCGLALFVRDHYARRPAALQGVNIDAEDAGTAPPPAEKFRSKGGSARIAVRVAEVTVVNALIRRIRFVRRDGGPMPAFSGGAHTVAEMDDHGTRRRNPCALMGDPADTTGYSISDRRNDAGRGGPLCLHRHGVPGMEMVISHPVNPFALNLRAKKHLMLAGGIGITPLLTQIAQLAALAGGSICIVPGATRRFVPLAIPGRTARRARPSLP